MPIYPVSVFLARSIATLLEGQDLLRGKSNPDIHADDGDGVLGAQLHRTCPIVVVPGA